MKISILTFSRSKNYGGNLQCYALQQYLESKGYEVEQIDIQRPRPKMSLLSKLLRIGDYYYFPKFWNKYIHYSKSYKSVSELKNNPPVSDCYIVGSDQVWNPNITKSLDPLVYFFNFTGSKGKKIAYAASFGLAEWPDKKNEKDVKSLLQDFDYIGVREEEAINICNETFGVNAELVLDPTFLLDSYDDVCGDYDPKNETNQMVLFTFTQDSTRDKVCLNLSNSLGSMPIQLKGIHKRPGFQLKRFASVAEWLRTIRYAKYVITDSFHCTVFCILFHKQFIATPAIKGRNGRIFTLLKNFGLEERFCKDWDDLAERGYNLLSTPIDYNSVDEKKKVLQENSRKFLIKALS